MGENTELSRDLPSIPTLNKKTLARGFDWYGNPVTDQLRVVGQRRREAEEKLDRHLQDARRH